MHFALLHHLLLLSVSQVVLSSMVDQIVLGSVVGAVIQVLLTALLSFSSKHTRFIRDVQKDLDRLTSTLEMIQKVLYDAEIQQSTSESVSLWLANLESLAFEAHTVLDDFNYALLSKQRSKVKSVFSSHANFSRLKLGRGIRSINHKLESINNDAAGFGLQNRPAVAHPNPNVLATDSYSVDSIFLGRNDDVSRIVEKLTVVDQPDRIFSVVPIVGMGGLGKTTLARKVFNHEKIRTHFGKRIWVHVSRNFDPMILFMRILEVLTSENSVSENREVVLQKLKVVLWDKTFLLVLDDVWNEDVDKWQDFANSFSGVTRMKGNGIIVTTRNTEVASIMKPLHIHHLKGLSEEDCFSIIKEKTFGKEPFPSQFEATGRKIARRCKGLPLAASVVGGALHGKSEEKWLAESGRLSFSESDESYFNKILRRSFNHLPSPLLKKCFAYCSIFPKGEEIETGDIVELWMAEGLVQSDDMEMEGGNFLDILLQSSLLQAVERDGYGNVTRCSMHDLVYDLASSLLKNKSPPRYVGREFGEKEAASILQTQNNLRTLFFRKSITDGMMSNFNCLHSLTIMGYHVVEVSDSIRKLIHLRYLNISCTAITRLPKSIGKLYFLQTFRANGGKLIQLPSKFTNLVSLRHLHVDAGVDLPPEIGKLTSLRTLAHFRVSNEHGHRIEELGSLQNLRGKLRIYNLEKVRDGEEAKKANLSQKPNLLKLCLSWDKSEVNSENVLEGLQPHPNLKSLSIKGFRGTRFPLWARKMAVRGEGGGNLGGLNWLVKIKLSNCYCEEIPKMGHLSHLKHLILDSLSSVRSIGPSFYGFEEKGREKVVVFPCLEKLTLTNMPNLTEWAEVNENAQTTFPHLEHLDISECRELRELPKCLHSLTSLKTLSLVKLRTLNNLPSLLNSLESSPHLVNLTISQVPNFMATSGFKKGCFLNLKQLELDVSLERRDDSGGVRKTVDGILQACNKDSLWKLNLVGMEVWDSLPEPLQYLTAISYLWLENFGIEALPAWLEKPSSIQIINLHYCKNLKPINAMQHVNLHQIGEGQHSYFGRPGSRSLT